jgi:hypothetical protein
VFDFEPKLDGIAEAYDAHGRTAGDQVTVARGIAVMATWIDDELRRVGSATELELASARADGTLRP